MVKSELIISENISKSFGDNHAVVDFSLTVKQGEISGIVGPDGAGKTTAMRMLSTVSTPDSGSLYINGVNALSHILDYVIMPEEHYKYESKYKQYLF